MHRQLIPFVVQEKQTQHGKAIILKKKKKKIPAPLISVVTLVFSLPAPWLLISETGVSVGHCGAAARIKPDQASEGLEAGPC